MKKSEHVETWEIVHKDGTVEQIRIRVTVTDGTTSVEFVDDPPPTLTDGEWLRRKVNVLRFEP